MSLAKCVGMWSGVLSGILLAAGLAQAQEPYKISADGQEVVDSRNGLVWSRCLIGMRMRAGRCQGQPLQVPFVLVAGKVDELRQESGKAWRLPALSELRALTMPLQADPVREVAAIDPKAFPGTPLLRVWTSNVSGPHYQYWISFLDGATGESTRSTSMALRLVREP